MPWRNKLRGITRNTRLNLKRWPEHLARICFALLRASQPVNMPASSQSLALIDRTKPPHYKGFPYPCYHTVLEVIPP